MIRRYGPAPYRVLFLHGGPGAAGSVGGACLELGKICGVLEPWQSKYSAAELTEELDGQIRDFATAPVTLIGHSWGAWLSLLYAATHPQTVSRLVWIGCPPLDESYAPLINARRMQNLTVQEAKQFAKALEILEKGPEEQKAQALKTLDALACRADATEPPEDDTDIPAPDEKAFAAVWPQAAALRARGTLLKAAQMLACPVTVIHGENDPHPPQGVTAPLTRLHISFTEILLPRCGHTPWAEKYARAPFFRALCALLYTSR